MMNSFQYIGSFFAMIGFWMLAAKSTKLRWWGFFLNLVSTFLLIPWAIWSENYGPIMIWACVLGGSIHGMVNNKN